MTYRIRQLYSETRPSVARLVRPTRPSQGNFSQKKKATVAFRVDLLVLHMVVKCRWTTRQCRSRIFRRRAHFFECSERLKLTKFQGLRNTHKTSERRLRLRPRMECLRVRVQVLGFIIQGQVYRVQGSGSSVQGFAFGVLAFSILYVPRP